MNSHDYPLSGMSVASNILWIYTIGMFAGVILTLFIKVQVWNVKGIIQSITGIEL